MAGETTSADNLPDLERIQRTVTGIRGLEFKKSVPAVRQSREDLAAFVDEWMEEVLPADRVETVSGRNPACLACASGLYLGRIAMASIREQQSPALFNHY